jgi:signal transduction histidine kinase
MQSLAVVKLRLSFIENGMNEDRTPAMMECKSLYHHIDGVIENVRRLSRDLSPSILEDLGLSAALQWLINNLLAKNYYHVETSIEVTHLDLLFPQDSQIMIYRVFQEALTNVVKHAQASRLSVNIKNQNGSVSFSLEDDGKGFDLRQVIEKAENEKGLGLLTMHERVRLLRGSLDIWSQEGKGTRISFTVPMEESLSS